MRENFETKKREWDRLRQELEEASKQNIEKKGEKISKFQGDIHSLSEKLRE